MDESFVIVKGPVFVVPPSGGESGFVPPSSSSGEALTDPLRTPSLVIFVDEIDATRSLPFSTDEFFAAMVVRHENLHGARVRLLYHSEKLQAVHIR